MRDCGDMKLLVGRRQSMVMVRRKNEPFPFSDVMNFVCLRVIPVTPWHVSRRHSSSIITHLTKLSNDSCRRSVWCMSELMDVAYVDPSAPQCAIYNVCKQKSETTCTLYSQGRRSIDRQQVRILPKLRAYSNCRGRRVNYNGIHAGFGQLRWSHAHCSYWNRSCKGGGGMPVESS